MQCYINKLLHKSSYRWYLLPQHTHTHTQPQSYARVMENIEPHLVEPVVIELGDADSEEHGCPCSLEFHTSTPGHIRDKFTLTPLGR